MFVLILKHKVYTLVHELSCTIHAMDINSALSYTMHLIEKQSYDFCLVDHNEGTLAISKDLNIIGDE